MSYHYIKNGKPFVSEEPIFFFEWVYKGGSVTFGMHGTEAEYNASTVLDRDGKDRELRQKRVIPTVNPIVLTADPNWLNEVRTTQENVARDVMKMLGFEPPNK